MTCKGICTQYQARKPIGGGRYTIGQKRCQECEIFINYDGRNCPCCGYRLRQKPRNRKFKAILREPKIEKKHFEVIIIGEDNVD